MDTLDLRITSRALIIENQKLLFVSDEGHYWYLPGGKLEKTETLTACVEREVYEETGLTVQAGLLQHVLECFDVQHQQHKIHFYFQTTVLTGRLSESWEDKFGSVKFFQYFNLAEIQANKAIVPRFLAKGDWCYPNAKIRPVYEGCVRMRGFEMVE